MQKESLAFGHGMYIGSVIKDPSFFEASPDEQAQILGWANGCPVVNELIAPDNRGPETMRDRYGEVNFWFRYVLHEAYEHNLELANKLNLNVKRSDPAGHFEKESVPQAYEQEMAPMGTLPGYAIPRLLIKQFGNPKAINGGSRLSRGIEVLEKSVAEADSPAQLLALVAEGLYRAGDLTSTEVLQGTLPMAWLQEHRSLKLLRVTKQALVAYAPTLWNKYAKLTHTELRDNCIV